MTSAKKLAKKRGKQIAEIKARQAQKPGKGGSPTPSSGGKKCAKKNRDDRNRKRRNGSKSRW